MNVIRIILSVLLVLISVALVVIILAQKGKNAGLTGSIGGAGAETFWGQNKKRSREGRMDLITKILTAAFVILSLLIGVVS